MELEPVKRLTRDLKNAAVTLSADEARFLVDYYYAMQEDRIRAGHQVRTLRESAEPHEVLAWLGDNTSILEQQIKRALDAYTEASIVGQWSKSIVGIGPIISAGLLAHIDLEPWKCGHTDAKPRDRCRPEAPHGPACHRIRIDTCGQIWRFAGLDPTVRWEKKTKRPWNASLKTLTWKIGESFVKVSGHADDVYGKLYLQRKALEQERNADGAFADQAREKLDRFKIDKKTDAYAAYSTGKLPPGHLHARAKRWAVKLFLAHWHHVAYETRFGIAPPKPYILTQGNHAHYLAPPNWPMA